ncbi:MAG: sulfate adenylyltransferase subunit CysN [Spirochaetales bacterium]|nr:sulfate adenylyltransferase subunit CysN [Spirochaetales bacterium]
MEKSLLRFVTSGSVDDGKSTLIGRLLYETNCIFEDQYEAVKKTSKKTGKKEVDLSLLLDGLSAEREQKITIDVAYRYFSTAKRKFIIADSPGHEQYTRNMVTGASNSQLAIILIDARNGILTQSKRHGFLISLLQIPHLIVAVNKMDLVDYSQEVFEKISDEYLTFSEKLDIHDIIFIPISALKGDNVVSVSSNMKWYDGKSLLQILEDVHVTADRNLIDFRFPVQYVLRPHQDFRGYAGTLTSGTISPDEEVLILPSGKTSVIKSIVADNKELKEAYAGQAIVLTLKDNLDVSRGDMIVRKNNLPHINDFFDAMLCWMSEIPLSGSKHYLLKHTTQTVKVYIKKIHYKININTLHRQKTTDLTLNEIGRVEIKTAKPLFFDAYKANHGTGSFILIDPLTNHTAAAGMIREIPHTVSEWKRSMPLAISHHEKNLRWEAGNIPLSIWEEHNGHKAGIIWLTGLSGSGKSTLAKHLVKELFERGCQVMYLDGDNIRQGLNNDLGFSQADRTENIRRIGETAKLFFSQGNIVICAFISPFQKDRDFVRSLVPKDRFIELYMKCDIEVCKERDPKGLYKKAYAGEIPDFTGVSSPYEAPAEPEIAIETDVKGIQENLSLVLDYLVKQQFIE